MSADRDAPFVRFAAAFGVYLLLVILFGAWVRISGSGAGCGDHWPLCNGELVPRSPSAKTMIEYTHRVSSGFTGPLALVLVVWAWRRFAARAGVRGAALAVAGFVAIEGAVGAGLVLKELVESDASMARAVVIAFHLANTFGLMAAISLCALRAARGGRTQGVADAVRRALAACLGATVIVGASGAITALGDTLFPVAPYQGQAGWFAHVRDDLQLGAHFLVRLRVWHPVLAVFVAVSLLVVLGKVREETEGEAARLATAATLLLWLQLALGLASVVLRAPGWLQLAHLLVAQLLWCALCLVYGATHAEARRPQPAS